MQYSVLRLKRFPSSVIRCLVIYLNARDTNCHVVIYHSYVIKYFTFLLNVSLKIFLTFLFNSVAAMVAQTALGALRKYTNTKFVLKFTKYVSHCLRIYNYVIWISRFWCHVQHRTSRRASDRIQRSTHVLPTR